MNPAMNQQQEESEPPSEPGSSEDPAEQSSRELNLHNTLEKSDGFSCSWIESKTLQVLNSLNINSYLINVIFVNDERMSQLHMDFSNIPGTTDVLTFDLRDAQDHLEVDIFVCVDVAQRVVSTADHGCNEELLLYITHGILHLLGYNDHTPEEHQIMHEKEDEILTSIGVGAVYNNSKNRDMDKQLGDKIS